MCAEEVRSVKPNSSNRIKQTDVTYLKKTSFEIKDDRTWIIFNADQFKAKVKIGEFCVIRSAVMGQGWKEVTGPEIH
jgi:hypothetical protein